MQGQFIKLLLFGIGLLLADAYILSGIRSAFPKRKWPRKSSFTYTYWVINVLLVAGMLLSVYVKFGVGAKAGTLMLFCTALVFKTIFLLFLLAADAKRLFSRRTKKSDAAPATAVAAQTQPQKIDAIPRSEFLLKAGLIAGAAPLVSLGFAITTGAYDYHVRRQTLYLPKLPKKFNGIRLAQISDIHSGSFYNKRAVLGGVEMLMREKADFIFFTGDLVNMLSKEFNPYFDIFNKVKAPLGVYSSLGNHDYGDYYSYWPGNSKQKNFNQLVEAHRLLGWDLLRNENRRLKVDGEEIGILGVENWGALSRFPKYGRLDLATQHTDDLPVKLLLSHDPSHWRGEVLPHYPQIDVMFSGHTHGMQFGVRAENFQWSPIEYVYKEWAGHYQQAQQQLYVNVGYGFLGFPGRVGILPEITLFELKAAEAPKINT
jgi:predicted MPP superfamily phosphohydrolase